MFTVEEFVSGITNTTPNLSATVEGDLLSVTRTRYIPGIREPQSDVIAQIPLEQFCTLSQHLQTDYNYFNTSLFTSAQNYLEVAIQQQDHNRPTFYLMHSEQNGFEIQDHDYQLSISHASPQYLFFLFCSFSNSTNESYVSPIHLHSDEVLTNMEDFFEAFRIYTVKIASPRKCSLTEFKHMLDAYIFNIAYNYNISLAVAEFTNERIFRRISTRRGGQLFPYRKYKQDLTKYYQQAVSSNIPFMQYLAFYHVAEFFFEKISEDETFQVIRNLITRPSFSPYRHEDIRNFYNTIKKKMRDQRDDGVWNEKNGLLLCLKQYVPDLSVLKDSIDRIDRYAIDYYQTTAVAFADDGKIIDFSEETEKVYSAIRNRIYATRNAIAHSKEGEKLKYEPFKHDKQLAKELPLIRAVAEEIIINSAEPINYNFTKQ